MVPILLPQFSTPTPKPRSPSPAPQLPNPLPITVYNPPIFKTISHLFATICAIADRQRELRRTANNHLLCLIVFFVNRHSNSSCSLHLLLIPRYNWIPSAPSFECSVEQLARGLPERQLDIVAGRNGVRSIINAHNVEGVLPKRILFNWTFILAQPLLAVVIKGRLYW